MLEASEWNEIGRAQVDVVDLSRVVVDRQSLASMPLEQLLIESTIE